MATRPSVFTGRDLMIALSMVVITMIVLVYGNRSTYLRSKAFQQTSTGIRIQASEMTTSGNVQKDSGSTYLQF